MQLLAITAATIQWQAHAQQLSEQLKLPIAGCVSPELVSDFSFVLECGDTLQLCATGRKAPGPVKVDFVTGGAAHRRKFGGGKSQQVAKAVGLRSGFYPRVVDATAGLGRDAFVLATLGCEVRMLERNPIVRALLADGLSRLQRAAWDDRELQAIAARLSLSDPGSIEEFSAANWLANQAEESVPVVYLDPMFPSREKSAKVKKEMAVFHHLIGTDDDADELLAPAMAACYYRTVVKRPKSAPFLAGQKPMLSLEGKSGRFDIYTKHGLPK